MPTQLAVATVLVATTALLHLASLAGLIRLLQTHAKRFSTPHERLDQAVAVVGAAFGLFALHTAEIWLYAGVYRLFGEFANFDDALYASTASYAATGAVTLSRRWRLLGAIEGVNGVLLLGWSTAFFVSVVRALGALEHVKDRRRRGD